MKKTILMIILIIFCSQMQAVAEKGTWQASYSPIWLLIDNEKKELKAIFAKIKTDNDGEITINRLPLVKYDVETYNKFYNLKLSNLPKDYTMGQSLKLFLEFAANKQNSNYPKPSVTPELEVLMEELFKTEEKLKGFLW